MRNTYSLQVDPTGPSPDKAALRRMERTLTVFQSLDPTHLPVHFVQVFLFVAQEGSCTYRDIQERFGITNASVSRTVNALGSEHRRGHEGFGLLQVVQDPQEGRRLLVQLTDKGKTLRQEIAEL